MAIKKQEFYEGAALHLLIRSGKPTSIQYYPPFFLLNDKLSVYLKYSTRARSPWGFTFTADEQNQMQIRAFHFPITIGLICGSDGVVALSYKDYLNITPSGKTVFHISCYRRHGEHYEVNGPNGKLAGKVAPSNWQRILNSMDCQ